MEPIVSSETLANKTQTPGIYPKENILHLEQGENLKSRIICMYLLILTCWNLHAEGLVHVFVLLHCATLRGALFVSKYVISARRQSCRVFILVDLADRIAWTDSWNHICAGGKCSTVNSYNYICAGCKYSILFA
jgi:hypothetical protein